MGVAVLGLASANYEFIVILVLCNWKFSMEFENNWAKNIIMNNQNNTPVFEIVLKKKITNLRTSYSYS